MLKFEGKQIFSFLSILEWVKSNERRRERERKSESQCQQWSVHTPGPKQLEYVNLSDIGPGGLCEKHIQNAKRT